jgi:hypothetical protein
MLEHPIFIFLIISTAMALPFTKNLVDFSKYFLVSSVLQVLLVRIYSNIVQFFIEKLKNERMKEYSKQGMEVTCPCYKEKKFLLPIKLQEDNAFSCVECNKDFSVDISARSFLQTNPIDIEKADVAFIEVMNKIQNSSK